MQIVIRIANWMGSHDERRQVCKLVHLHLAQTMVAVIIAPLQFLANQSVVLPTVGQFWPATAFHMGSTAPPVNDSFDSFGFDCTDG